MEFFGRKIEVLVFFGKFWKKGITNPDFVLRLLLYWLPKYWDSSLRSKWNTLKKWGCNLNSFTELWL